MPGCRTWQEVAGAGAGLLLNENSPQADGLVACYRVTSGPGPTVFDLTGRKRHMTISGNPTADFHSKVGRALALDATGDKAVGPLDIPLTAAGVTMTAWMYVDSTAAFGFLIGKSSGSGFMADTDWGLYGGFSSGAYFVVRNTANSGGLTLPVGSWFHMAGSFDATACIIYVDGAVAFNGAVGSGDTTNTTTWPFQFLAASGGAARMSDVRVYNRTLRQSEVSHHVSPSTRYDLYWRKSRSAPKHVAAAATTFGFLRDNAGLGVMGGGPFSRSNAGLGVLA